MSELVPSVVGLVSGLDLTSAKLIAEPGSMLACKNYELVDLAGYRRIDGLDYFDGGFYPYTREAYVYSVVLDDEPSDPDFWNDLTTGIYTVSMKNGRSKEYSVFRSVTLHVLSAGDGTITLAEPLPWIESFTTDGTTITYTSNGAATVAEWNTYLTALRATREALPYPALGLHYHRNTLYAVSSNTRLYSAGSGLAVFGPTSGSAQIGDVLTSAGGGSGTIVAMGVETLATGSDAFYVEITDVTGTVSGATNVEYSVAGTPTTFTVVGTVEAESAQLYRSNTSGWSRVQTGWTIQFSAADAGLSTGSYYVNDKIITIASVQILEGSVDDSTAAGFAQVSSAVASGVTPGTTNAIYLGNPNTGGVVVGTLISLEFNTLPGRAAMLNVSSRYVAVSHNFYATELYDSFYAANGVGKAFAYSAQSGFTFIPTRTSGQDNPRHVAAHQGVLVLGFRNGEYATSVVGEPTLFNGELGATAGAVGDRITGLMPQAGTVLGIFCEESIHGLTGSRPDDFQLQTISAYTGAVEYTVTNMGKPVFCDAYGISTLEQTAAYGDFLGNRQSNKIMPWLRPRAVSGIYGRESPKGIVMALPVRSKNQYRVFFNDGNVLTMTLSLEGAPQFSFQKYEMDDDLQGLVPFAWSSQVGEKGQEFVHVAHYGKFSTFTSAYVYQLDIGWTFAGRAIDAYFEVNPMFMEAPYKFHTIRKLRLHGLSYGAATINVTAAGMDTDYGTDTYTTTQSNVSLPKASASSNTLSQDLQTYTTKTDLATRGLSIRLKFTSSPATPEPSHICQVLVVRSVPGGATDD